MLRYVCIVFLTLSAMNVAAQEVHKINYTGIRAYGDVNLIHFEGVSYGAQIGDMPSYCGQFVADGYGSLVIANAHFEVLTQPEIAALEDFEIPQKIAIKQHLITTNGIDVISYCLIPLRKNPTTGALEKLISFTLNFQSEVQASERFKTTVFADTSVLATGSWYRLGVVNDGVYKITPQFLADCGFSATNIPSSALRVFGDASGMLPEANAAIQNTGLSEIAIYINDGGDGIFNGNDYALFYAKGPHTWSFQPEKNAFKHTYNIYSEKNYYFITINSGVGKRIVPTAYTQTGVTHTTNTYDDFKFFEEDKVNLVGTGRQWFGDIFDFKTSYDYTMQFANVAVGDTAWLATRVGSRSTSTNTSMLFSNNGKQVSVLTLMKPSGTNFLAANENRIAFNATGNNFLISAVFNKNGNSSATAWLDYIELQVRSTLTYVGGALIFRDGRNFKKGGVLQYDISNAPAGMQVWDVTDVLNIRSSKVTSFGNTQSVVAPNDSLRTFVALAGSNFPLPEKIGAVVNQNLAGMVDVDMLIVAHPEFLAQAAQLAQFRRNHDGLSVFVVTPQQIYNEYSSGRQDVTAIKLMARHLYINPKNATPLKYLLLFGDASYDYKTREANMTNFVPIYQSEESFNLTSSYCTDDYFGFLAPNGGIDFYSETVDIGIGRFPVKTQAEAQAVVNKIIDYSTNAAGMKDWRNRYILVSDDVDVGWERDFELYMDRLAVEMDTANPKYNAQKIYTDSYQQTVMAGSQRYPDAQEDLFRKAQKGALLVSYTGHGGEVGWATERVLQLKDINAWSNNHALPFYTTITCEFARLDDPKRVSAAEQLFLNPEGGSIGLISTLRPIYATTSSYQTTANIYKYALTKYNNRYLTMGEVVQAAKNANGGSERFRFILIGDPAMHLAIPENNVLTDSINGVAYASFTDTLKALSTVTISGHVADENGMILENFDGLVYPTVFDKKTPRTTLRNDNQGAIFNYQSQENIIYKGKSTVKNGRFTFTFVVPLDINFAVGLGKISYYAENGVIDASGTNNLNIGSLFLGAKLDDKGPQVRLFINDTNFVSGGLTDKNPLSLALISDSSGINTVGTGIGHDIIGILDGNTSNPIILNDYFTAELNSYQKGTVEYPFFDLATGEHTLMVRAWDVNNNPGEATITFIVDESVELALSRVFNYPNPFINFTTFQFEHNRAGEPLEVEIQIFDDKGALRKTIKEQLTSQGNRINQITWDGKTDGGTPMGAGVYLYRVRVKSTKDNSETYGYSKLVFIK